MILLQKSVVFRDGEGRYFLSDFGPKNSVPPPSRASKAPKTPFLAGFQLTFEILNEIFGYLSLESQAAVQKPKRDFC